MIQRQPGNLRGLG